MIFKKLVSAFVVIVLWMKMLHQFKTDYPVSFYYEDRIDNFKACFDLNFNDRCDDNELSTTTI